MLERVQERSGLRLGDGTFGGVQLHGAQKALAQWAIVDDYNAVLDMSCGSGRLLRSLSRRYSLRACGIAEDEASARAMQAYLPNAEILCARRADLPWRDGSFDAVFCQINKTEKSADPAFLREAMRVLKPNGQLLIAVRGLPEAVCAFREALGEQAQRSRVKPRDLMRAMEEAGFDDVSYRFAQPLVGVAMGWKRCEDRS